MSDFDVVIVGSGPSALGALSALRSDKRIAVISGESQLPTDPKSIHAKIRAVSIERNEPPGLVPFGSQSCANKSLFETATVGGLANYWGQQFLPQLERDPWPSAVFSSYSDYLAECDAVAQLFSINGGATLTNCLPHDSGFHVRRPRLLTGHVAQPHSGTLAMREAFNSAARLANCHIIRGRALSFERAATGWTLQLSNGHTINARKVLLAAGVIGSAALVLRSFNDLKGAQFCDHTPWMVYMTGLRSWLATNHTPDSNHFNALTIEQVRKNKSAIFASMYDMRFAELNLILASTLRSASSVFAGWRGFPGANFVQPTQVWTPSTSGKVEINADTREIRTVPAIVDADKDADLAVLIESLTACGGRRFKVTSTRPGHGFHYYATEFVSAAGGVVPISTLLQDRTDDEITCIDSSVQGNIGCRPPTLTFMATARRLSKLTLT